MKIGVYGLGRFGKFWANLLAQKFEVTGYDKIKPPVMPDKIKWGDEDELIKCKTIFLCVPISEIENVLVSIKDKLTPCTIVMDTCSVKSYPVDLMQRILPYEIEIISVHPMFGPDSGNNGVAGLPVVICPVRNKDESYILWKNIFTSFGLKTIKLTPLEHDQEAAWTQGITHFLGRVLGELKLTQSLVGTLGYNKLLEIVQQTCNDSWGLFHDLQHYNPYTNAMRMKLMNAFNEIDNKLKDS